ncbi:MAG: MFS transporter, partial [Rhodocyclaceae bacterium]|nr:MFS transporter [Rhodocyclaceae bacterium]
MNADLKSWQILAYGMLGFPLAFAALPLYVYVPRLYVDSVGLPLALVGALLLLTRFADALIDPLLGRWSDQVGNRRRLIALALPLLAIGLVALLAPPDSAQAMWLIGALVVTFLGYSLATINYHAWGAELGSSSQERVQVTSIREFCSLGGVVLAASIPAILADDTATALQFLAWLFVPLLAIAALITLRGTPVSATLPV